MQVLKNAGVKKVLNGRKELRKRCKHCIRIDAKAAGSNPVIPTSMNEKPFEISTFQRVF